jgi:hypothetical protein
MSTLFFSLALFGSTDSRLKRCKLTQCSGETMLHEMPRLDLVANSIKNNPNPQIGDLFIGYNVFVGPNRGQIKQQKAYGPELAKVLRRYLPFQNDGKPTGYVTQRNDDNYVWFALAKYMQNKTNSYA